MDMAYGLSGGFEENLFVRHLAKQTNCRFQHSKCQANCIELSTYVDFMTHLRRKSMCGPKSTR